MDELKELMGESYKEDLSVEDITSFLKGKKLADLSSGQYVDKNKHDKAMSKLQEQLTSLEKNKSINNDDSKDAEIEKLQNDILNLRVQSSKDTALGLTSEIRKTLNIEETNTEFTNFVDSIISDDYDKSKNIVNYFVKIVNDAYTKGSKDESKNAMGNFGKFNAATGNNDGKELDNLGKRLAQNSANTGSKVDYFKRN